MKKIVGTFGRRQTFVKPGFSDWTFKVIRSLAEKKFTTGQQKHLCRRA